jgi:DNA-binding transcriptional LysR family regulator
MSRAITRRFFRHGLLPQLLVFEAVARLGGVTRAAEELHLAQPTVSLQLKKLADTLEVTLFEPQGRRLRLTGAGHALREICDEMMHCLTRAEAKLEAFRRPKTQYLRIAAESGVRAVAAELVAEFCVRHPGVQTSLHVAPRPELLARLAAGSDEVYLFGRWSIVHPANRAPGALAELFLREALLGALPGIQSVAQPVAQQVEGKD